MTTCLAFQVLESPEPARIFSRSMATPQERPELQRCSCSLNLERFSCYLHCPLTGRTVRSEACAHAAVSRWRFTGFRELYDLRRYPVTVEGRPQFVIAMELSTSICTVVDSCALVPQTSIKNDLSRELSQEEGLWRARTPGQISINTQHRLHLVERSLVLFKVLFCLD